MVSRFIRPKKGKYNLTDAEMDCLSWFVLSGCTRIEAFARFTHPEYFANGTMTPMLEAACKSFFAQKEAKQYLQDFKEYLDSFDRKASAKEVIPPADAGTLEERKAKAKQKAMDYAMRMADELNNADVDAELVLKVLDKVGILDDEEVAEEAPRRYVPTQCGSCSYRQFVEEHCEEVNE